MKTILFALLLGASFLVFESRAPAATPVVSSPTLSIITPRGVQRGGEHTLKFTGARLNDAEEIFLYDSGVEVTGIEAIDANNINVSIKVAPDCRLGEHVAQVRTKTGISDYRSFYVGALKDVTEKESNNTIETAEKIEQNVTINGVVTNEDVDYFLVSATKDQRLSVEIEAVRLGAMFDPFIAVLNKDRFEIAVSDDTPQFKQDGFVSVKIPEDGDYLVMVRETSYGGNPNCRYRLHVGNFPRPAVAYPAGGPAGGKMEIKLLGDPLGEITKQIDVPQTEAFRKGYFYEDESGISPSAVGFRIASVPNYLEVEPNNDFENLAAIEMPHAFNGIIQAAGDQDFFKFTAKAGQAFHVQCFARRIGSGLDPVINIFAADKKHIVGDDDTRRPDCYIRFQAPADGEYFLRVRDHLNRGDPGFVYRVEFNPIAPSLVFMIPRVDRYSQQRQTISVPRGNRFATLINARRADFGGPLELLNEGLPPGIKMVAQPMPPQLSLMPVVFEAEETAELGGSLVDLKGRHVEAEKNITGGFLNIADFALGVPNNTRYFGCQVNQLGMAVTEKVPFKLEIVQPNSPIVRNGSKVLNVVAHRDEGFDGQIRVQFPFRPPGVGTTYQVVIPKDKSEVDYPLNANGNAQLGKWPVYAIGWGNNNGASWVSTQLAELEIAQPFVTFQIPKTKCVQGESPKITCKLTHAASFEGEATAEMLGIPPNITIPPLTFNKETQELVFDVQTTDKSPVGNHKGLFCRVTITHNGEPVVSTAGRSQLQITKPKPPKKPAVATKPAVKKTEAIAPPQPDNSPEQNK